MKTKEYKGKILKLSYPEILKIKTEEPEWSAFASKGRGAAVVMVDPASAVAKASEKSIRNPCLTGALIEREGRFVTPKGIDGYERVIRMSETMGWSIVGTFLGRHKIVIKIWSVNSEWHDGTIWAELVNSVEVIGDRSKLRLTETPAFKPTNDSTFQKSFGILRNFPDGLAYLLDMANQIASLKAEHLEDSPEVFEILKRGIKREFHSLTKKKAQIRISSDSKRLWFWLQQYPADKYPEIEPLYFLAGFLASASADSDGILD